ncbi:MAG: hypothetical protein AABY89_12150, partial [Acidobacteriota bacterium]
MGSEPKRLLHLEKLRLKPPNPLAVDHCYPVIPASAFAYGHPSVIDDRRGAAIPSFPLCLRHSREC